LKWDPEPIDPGEHLSNKNKNEPVVHTPKKNLLFIMTNRQSGRTQGISFRMVGKERELI
jgi:hypothetical protein